MDGWMDALGFLPPSAVISCYCLRFPADSEVEGRRGAKEQGIDGKRKRMREGDREKEGERERLIRSDLISDSRNRMMVLFLFLPPSLPSISLSLFSFSALESDARQDGGQLLLPSLAYNSTASTLLLLYYLLVSFRSGSSGPKHSINQPEPFPIASC